MNLSAVADGATLRFELLVKAVIEVLVTDGDAGQSRMGGIDGGRADGNCSADTSTRVVGMRGYLFLFPRSLHSYLFFLAPVCADMLVSIRLFFLTCLAWQIGACECKVDALRAAGKLTIALLKPDASLGGWELPNQLVDLGGRSSFFFPFRHP